MPQNFCGQQGKFAIGVLFLGYLISAALPSKAYDDCISCSSDSARSKVSEENMSIM